ncbi:hypothetical protein WME75_17775 [Sorangium sp. So ce1014]|uniref:hypothetical protein n=1 Tax=Sorangium sp. So ce1014 TaxID=3133326 RepID=UPI003F5E67B9
MTNLNPPEVNVEARGDVSCDLSGCSGDVEVVPGAGKALSGCTAEPGRTSPFATTGVAAALASIGLAAESQDVAQVSS